MVIFICAILIGSIVGLLGSGPAILSLPLLLYIKGETLSTAVLMSLIIAAALSAVGGFSRLRDISIKSILLFLPAALVGSFYGVKYSFIISEFWKIILLSFVSFIAAGLIFFKLNRQKKLKEKIMDFLSPHLSTSNIIIFVFFSYILGFLSSLLGISGGFLMTPLFIGVFSLNLPVAVATSLFLSLFNSLFALFFYYQKHGVSPFLQLDWVFLSLFLVLGLMGVVLGLKFSRYTSPDILKKILGVFLLFLSVVNLYQAFLIIRI